MRTTLNLQNELVQRASEVTGIKEKTALIHAGLKALVERAAAERLIALGGSDPKATAGRRRRSNP
jgi:Arc/MetJ family transcription regulator